jgi:hypothetical protein
LSEDSDGPGAAAGSESKRTRAPGNTAGPASMPPSEAGTRDGEAGTPGSQAGTPGSQAGTPGSQSGTPGSQSGTPEGEAGTPESEAGPGAQPVPKPRTGQQRPDGAEAGGQAAGEAAAAGAGGTGEAAADDERAELERLRAEVSDLRGEQSRAAAKRKGRWRAWVSAVLIVVGCILAPVAVLGVWGANQVSNTDRYVANMAPLIHDPAIQQALSARITTEITSRLNVQATANQAAAQAAAAHLPRLANLLHTFSGQIASGVNSAIGAAVAKIVASPAMAAVWTQANRIAHAGIVRVLSGQGGGAVDVKNDEVVLNLGPLITQAKQQLVARGLTVANNIPAVNATFPLFQAHNLAKAQQGYRLILTLKWVLPFLSLALLALGVYVARRHRRALIGAALGLAASMLVLGIGLTIFRSIYLNSVPSNVSSSAAAALYDTLIRFIRQGLRVILVVGLVIAAGAFLTGPSATAVRTRKGVVSGIDWLRARGERAGVRTGPVGVWTSAHKGILRVSAVALVGVIFVFWGHPTAAVVIWLVVLLLVLLGLIELLGGGRPAAQQAAPQ